MEISSSYPSIADMEPLTQELMDNFITKGKAKDLIKAYSVAQTGGITMEDLREIYSNDFSLEEELPEGHDSPDDDIGAEEDEEEEESSPVKSKGIKRKKSNDDDTMEEDSDKVIYLHRRQFNFVESQLLT